MRRLHEARRSTRSKTASSRSPSAWPARSAPRSRLAPPRETLPTRSPPRRCFRDAKCCAHPFGPRAGQGCRHGRPRRRRHGGRWQLRRCQPALRRAFGEQAVGFVKLNMRPYYAEGSSPSPSRCRAARLASARRRRRLVASGSLLTKIGKGMRELHTSRPGEISGPGATSTR
jgi:hypothetical protein